MMILFKKVLFTKAQQNEVEVRMSKKKNNLIKF